MTDDFEEGSNGNGRRDKESLLRPILLGDNHGIAILTELNTLAKSYGLEVTDFHATISERDMERLTLDIELLHPSKQVQYNKLLSAIKAHALGEDESSHHELAGTCEEILEAIENAHSSFANKPGGPGR